MKNLKLVINKLVLLSKQKKTKSAIFIGNTKKRSKNSFYHSGIRKHINFSYMSIIVYSNNITKKIIKLIDGKIDIIFYDLKKNKVLIKKFYCKYRGPLKKTQKYLKHTHTKQMI